MQNDFEHRNIAFHNRARQILISVYRDFKCAVVAIDRQQDKNVFQLLSNRFKGRLKQQLQSVAREILDQTRLSAGVNGINLTLSHFIEEYEHEFIQKMKAL